jgi:antitoxin PrlF
MLTARLSSKGQVTVPKKVRELLGVKPGQKIAFVAHGDTVEVIAVREDLMSLAGIVKVKGPQDFKTIREQTMKEVSKRVVKKG